MDNKHATPEDLSYLAAMIDGEGCISIQKNERHNGASYACMVKVTNTDANIIEKVQRIFLSMGINPGLRERHNEHRGRDWKNWFEVFVTKKSLIKYALEQVLPYLAGKTARAVIMLRFIDNTMDRDHAVDKLHELNRRGKSSETTREAPAEVLDEDIVQAA